MKRNKSLFGILFALIICLTLAMPALAQEKGKKEKQDKVWGTIKSVPADPSGKLAPLAIENQKKEMVYLTSNAVTKKMEKIVGEKVEALGKLKEEGGKKVLEAWNFVRKESPDAPTKKPKADAG